MTYVPDSVLADVVTDGRLLQFYELTEPSNVKSGRRMPELTDCRSPEQLLSRGTDHGQSPADHYTEALQGQCWLQRLYEIGWANICS